jgi:hypothetical protein
MLKTETERVGRIVDSRLMCVVGENKDVFADSNEKILSLMREIENERLSLIGLQRKHILKTFRGVVDEYTKVYDEKPTTILMNYRDVNMLACSYNAETKAQKNEGVPQEGITREHVSEYSDKIEIDGIVVRKGCDQREGELRIYSFL